MSAAALRYTPMATVPRLRVDLSSDTVTRPTKAMRRAMANAEVGDEQRGEDPTVNALTERVGDLLGHEAAVFLPSGTMCNQIAVAVHCAPGDAFFCHRSAHPLLSEAGGASALAGAQPHPLDGPRGIFGADQLRAAIAHETRYAPHPSLVWVEQTANLVGGCCWSLDEIGGVLDVAEERSLRTHLDGARLLNATTATGHRAADYAGRFDTAWIDFSKGLGAPVGAVLAGSAALVDEAWRWKQRLGGSMRQSGIVAAGALHALEHHVERLAEDHANARRLAAGLAGTPGLRIDAAAVETNIVAADASAWPGGAGELVHRLTVEHGVRASFGLGGRVRFVTHLDVDANDIDVAVEAVHRLAASRV
ncbi:MAG: beta-eliminating lyase-related protein [Actinomycetota bacterium]|nr:beta-eliminating lyase-related protein [Actinomycetota bacterium]MDQ6947070.1 beta-eliminating lyase-related protein [Actinomycetota bacterium]